jgi:hypothetical protein
VKTPDAIDYPAFVRASDSLDELAARINGVFAVAEETTRKGLAHYREVGQMLLAAKEKCGHGNWLPWLKKNVKFSEVQAQRYMRLAKSVVTTDLETAWRVIQGNDEPEEEPPPSGFVAAPDPPPPDEESDHELPPERDDSDDDQVAPGETDYPPPQTVTADDGDNEFDLDEGDRQPSEGEPPAPAPTSPPPFVVPPTRPQWLVPGNNADPDNPFADILNKLAAVAAALTKAMAADETGVLKQYLLDAQRNKPANPLFVLNRELWVEGKKYGAQFIMLRPLRRLIRKAGEAVKNGKKHLKNAAGEYRAEDDQ